jgi:N-acyl-D-amino-acid deacylase
MVKNIIVIGFVLFFGAFVASCSPADEAEVSSTILIVNANIIDGTGTPSTMGAVRLSGDTIVGVGDLDANSNDTVIDAGGLTLAPGFIDTHSHHDGGLREDLAALPMVTQGITTIVVGQDGGHQYPIADFFNAYTTNPAAVNIATYVGHNTIRSLVMGDDSKRVASTAEIETMRLMVKGELENGALGFSSGLEYEPGIYSKRDEVLILAKEAAKVGGRYISHMRSEDRFFWDAVDEIITIGREAKMPVQISHFKLAAKNLWGETDRVIGMLDAARAEGIDITADIYPYTYWQSTIFVLLPERDPNDLVEIKNVLDNITPADGVVFTYFGPNPDYVNMSVAEIAQLRGTSEVQTMSDLMNEVLAFAAANPGARTESIMGVSMTQKDISALMQWEHSNICSDGGYLGHPRGFGAFPRVLATYVRDDKALTLEVAIQKMTSSAASHMGFDDRGLIKVGLKADLVLFDPATVQDLAEMRNGQVASVGIKHVWVNGVRVLTDGKTGAARPGMVLKR